MELRQLRHFIAIAEAENMRVASEKVHLSHPALSLSLKSLEDGLDVKLFDRNSRGVKLTDPGKHFLKYAYSILKQVDTAQSSVKSFHSNPSGLVRIGCTQGVSNVLGVPIYKALIKEYPEIEVELDDSQTPFLQKLFDVDLIDLMITFDIKDQQRYQCDALIEEEFFLVGKGSSQQESVEFSELAKYSIISNRDQSSAYLTYEKFQKETGVSLNIVPGLGSAMGDLALAESGFGSVIIPSSLFFNRLKGGEFTAQRIINPTIYRKAYLISPLHRTLSRAGMAVVDIIKQSVKEVHQKGEWQGNLLLS
ncbi:LysR family transcriptional regulator [Dasania marina]|uniref:LysR family transcriptional regulator n=1 Tax=Dasania marina TaxID=471499 RepID=UPI000362ECF9|nr:LysR family transcriptional regulator [Dasania marina]